MPHVLKFVFGVGLTLAANFAYAESSAFILSPKKGPILLGQCSRSTPQNVESFWTPERSQIAELERLIEPFLRSSPAGMGVLPLAHFHRQYVGFVKDGKHYIYGNFYRIKHKDEAVEPVVVCDGGSSFWGVVFSVDSKTFQELKFNGEA